MTTFQSKNDKCILLLFLFLALCNASLSATPESSVTLNNNNNENDNNNDNNEPKKLDNFPECTKWAAEGDCRTDPVFMNEECALSCDLQPDYTKIDVVHVKDDDESFFGLKEKNYDGRIFDLDQLEGYITLVVYLPKLCGRFSSFHLFCHIPFFVSWGVKNVFFSFFCDDSGL
uniref:ShKT domain-containing protein n=1 Tax=Ditylum brightwellii TaxID=49249 RepID=A0A7S4QL48_9STRA